VVFIEPLPSHPFGEEAFLTMAIRLVPPNGLFQAADQALGLNGQLVSYVRDEGGIPVDQARYMSPSDKKRVCEQRAGGRNWSLWHAETSNHRYNILVIYNEMVVLKPPTPKPEASFARGRRRVVVGKCPACGKDLRVKTTGVRSRMNLTCSCGNRTIIDQEKIKTHTDRGEKRRWWQFWR